MQLRGLNYGQIYESSCLKANNADAKSWSNLQKSRQKPRKSREWPKRQDSLHLHSFSTPHQHFPRQNTYTILFSLFGVCLLVLLSFCLFVWIIFPEVYYSTSKTVVFNQRKQKRILKLLEGKNILKAWKWSHFWFFLFWQFLQTAGT